MMSSQIKLISSLAVLASSVAIVSPLELGASASLPLHLATAVEAPEQATQPHRSSERSPLAEIAAQVRTWESNGREEQEGNVVTEGADESAQESEQVEHLDKTFRQYVFNKYGGFFFGDDEG
jgi:hypothetical protein